jgi:hypothetical protein
MSQTLALVNPINILMDHISNLDSQDNLGSKANPAGRISPYSHNPAHINHGSSCHKISSHLLSHLSLPRLHLMGRSTHITNRDKHLALVVLHQRKKGVVPGVVVVQ